MLTFREITKIISNWLNFEKKFQLWQLRNRSKNVPYVAYNSSNESKFYKFLSEHRLNNTTNQENHFWVEILKNCESL